MPGNVSNAAPSTVLPRVLARQFSRASEYPVLVNEYKNGEAQTGARAATARGRWQFTGRWTNAARQAFRAFFLARSGGLEPFYFYDPWYTDPRFSYDPTGAETAGRHTVRFEGPWSDALELGLGTASIGLIEVA